MYIDRYLQSGAHGIDGPLASRVGSRAPPGVSAKIEVGISRSSVVWSSAVSGRSRT